MIFKWGGKIKALLYRGSLINKCRRVNQVTKAHWQTTVVITDSGNNQP